MKEFEELLEKKIKEIISKNERNRLGTILTADEIEVLSKGKIKREKVYDLARNKEKTGFPAIRLGKKDVKVFEHQLIEWMELGGCPLDDD